MSLKISTEKHSNCTEILLSGQPLSELDFEELQDEVKGQVEEGNCNLILNLGGVKILNSLGINALIKVMTRCRNNGGDLYIVNISEKINQVWSS